MSDLSHNFEFALKQSNVRKEKIPTAYFKEAKGAKAIESIGALVEILEKPETIMWFLKCKPEKLPSINSFVFPNTKGIVRELKYPTGPFSELVQFAREHYLNKRGAMYLFSFQSIAKFYEPHMSKLPNWNNNPIVAWSVGLGVIQDRVDKIFKAAASCEELGKGNVIVQELRAVEWELKMQEKTDKLGNVTKKMVMTPSKKIAEYTVLEYMKRSGKGIPKKDLPYGFLTIIKKKHKAYYANLKKSIEQNAAKYFKIDLKSLVKCPQLKKEFNAVCFTNDNVSGDIGAFIKSIESIEVENPLDRKKTEYVYQPSSVGEKIEHEPSESSESSEDEPEPAKAPEPVKAKEEPKKKVGYQPKSAALPEEKLQSGSDKKGKLEKPKVVEQQKAVKKETVEPPVWGQDMINLLKENAGKKDSPEFAVYFLIEGKLKSESFTTKDEAAKSAKARKGLLFVRDPINGMVLTYDQNGTLLN